MARFYHRTYRKLSVADSSHIIIYFSSGGLDVVMTNTQYVNRVTSMTYAFAQIMQGLLLHPYQTMQSLVRERVFVWMAATPTVVLAGLTLVWRYLIVPLVSSVVSCSEIPSICTGLDFLALWVIFFCFYWQIMLLYLLFRFRWGYGATI